MPAKEGGPSEGIAQDAVAWRPDGTRPALKRRPIIHRCRPTHGVRARPAAATPALSAGGDSPAGRSGGSLFLGWSRRIEG